MSALKKAMLYLGLGPDEEYEMYAHGHNAQTPAPTSSASTEEPETTGPDRSSRGGVAPMGGGYDPTGTVRTIRPVPTESPRPAPAAAPETHGAIGAVRPAGPSPASASSAPAERPEGSVVRPLPLAVATKPYTVAPTSFNDAQEVGDRFMAKQPVIVNLQGAERDLARRIIDFASGLCYGLSGQMERVATQVYLLTPTNVEVSSEERERLLAQSDRT